METLSMDTGEVETQQESISLIPAEIWTTILERVGRANDLLNCRQVNRMWYSISTLICRHRFLPLNFSGTLRTSFYSTFKNCNNLPWSACKLHDGTSPVGVGIGLISLLQIREFIGLFGSHIHELTISGFTFDKNEGLLAIMGGIPNIKYLDISGIRILEPIQESFTSQLGRLKGLIASIEKYHTFRFVELLLNRPEVQLRSLQLTIVPGDWLIGSCEVLYTLITGIPILHLELRTFFPELFVELTRKRVQIQQLVVHIGIGILLHFPIPYSYSSLEVFLKNTADSLQQLTLFDNQIKQQRENSTLTIPTLHQLTYLGVKAGMTWEFPSRSPLLANVTTFTSEQFPKLAKVNALECSSRFGRVVLFDLGPFHTVTELVLSDSSAMQQNFLETDWNGIFPNLRKLDVEITGKELPLIFTKFRRLERLFLSVRCTPAPHLRDMSTILRGGREFGKGTRGASRTPSSLTLTCLKEFILTADRQQTICDAFVDSYLLRIQPLDSLYLNNVVVSGEYKEKLQLYHRKAEIYNRKNPKHYKEPPPSRFHGLTALNSNSFS